MTACMSNKDCGGGICSTPSEFDCEPNPIAGSTGHDPTLQVNQYKKGPAKFAVANNDCLGECDWNPDKGVGSCKSKRDGRVVGCYPSGPNASIIAPGHAQRDDHVGTVYRADTASASCILGLVDSATGCPVEECALATGLCKDGVTPCGYSQVFSKTVREPRVQNWQFVPIPDPE